MSLAYFRASSIPSAAELHPSTAVAPRPCVWWHDECHSSHSSVLRKHAGVHLCTHATRSSSTECPMCVAQACESSAPQESSEFRGSHHPQPNKGGFRWNTGCFNYGCEPIRVIELVVPRDTDLGRRGEMLCARRMPELHTARHRSISTRRSTQYELAACAPEASHACRVRRRARCSPRAATPALAACTLLACRGVAQLHIRQLLELRKQRFHMPQAHYASPYRRCSTITVEPPRGRHSADSNVANQGNFSAWYVHVISQAFREPIGFSGDLVPTSVQPRSDEMLCERIKRLHKAASSSYTLPIEWGGSPSSSGSSSFAETRHSHAPIPSVNSSCSSQEEFRLLSKSSNSSCEFLLF